MLHVHTKNMKLDESVNLEDVAAQTHGFVGADIARMASAMIAGGWEHAIWACHPTVLQQLGQVGNYFIGAGAVPPEGGYCGTLFCRPLYVTEKLPPLGQQGDIIFFDPQLYVVGLRQDVLIDTSEHTLFQTYQTVYRVWLRMDGRPWLSNVITAADGSILSPYVALSATAFVSDDPMLSSS